MAAPLTKRSEKTGMPPGMPVNVGPRPASPTRATLIDYSEKTLVEKEMKSAQECAEYCKRKTSTWLDIDGLGDIAFLNSLGSSLGLHPLVIEDILHTEQRPKLEAYDDYLYIVLRMLKYDGKSGSVRSEQVSIVLGKGFLLSFQEGTEDIFDPIRARIRNEKSRIRRSGPDYLAYALIDAIVDNYFGILEKMGERVEALETELISSPTPRTLNQLHKLKREMISLRKSVWPLREVLAAMERPENSLLVTKGTRVYLRDVYDHTIEAIETIETQRDILSGMVDIYLSSINNRMNEVMKLLTVVGTIFLPLTFIAGVYGMNFQYMPELSHPLGYFAVLALMSAVAGGMLVYFRMKKWL